MGRQRIPIDKITWSHTYRYTPDDLAPLEESMRKHGVKHRPLLNGAYECVDGARQLEIFRQWGVQDVDVIVTDDLDFSMKVLAQRHDNINEEYGPVAHHPVTAWRAEKLHEVLLPQVQARVRAIRIEVNSTQGRNGRIKGTYKKRPEYRATMGEILHLHHEHIYGYYINTVRALKEADREEREFLHDQLRRLEEERSATIYQVMHRHKRWLEERQKESVLAGTNAKEQAEIINNALNVLAGLSHAVSGIYDLVDGHSQEDRARWAAAMTNHLSDITRFTRTLQRNTP